MPESETPSPLTFRVSHFRPINWLRSRFSRPGLRPSTPIYTYLHLSTAIYTKNQSPTLVRPAESCSYEHVLTPANSLDYTHEVIFLNSLGFKAIQRRRVMVRPQTSPAAGPTLRSTFLKMTGRFKGIQRNSNQFKVEMLWPPSDFRLWTLSCSLTS